MEIKAVKFRTEGFYTQPFVFGGEEGMDKFDPKVRYRGSLQNYLIDIGDEIILVDTGLPAGTPEEVADENSVLYTGKDICSYMDAFAALGYKPEQVMKILLTHKHGDHSGELKEELNVDRDSLEGLQLRYITLRNVKGEIRQNYYYFANLNKDYPKMIQSNEGVSKWFHIDEIINLEMPYTAKYVIEHYLTTGRFSHDTFVGVADGQKVQFVTMSEYK